MSKEFGEKLRLRRKERGLTTTAAAAALGVTQPAWNQWELGLREPKLEVLANIANLLDCSADWLLGLREPGATAIASGNGAVAVAGRGNRVTVTKRTPGEAPSCAKCPYKKKLKKFEALINK